MNGSFCSFLQAWRMDEHLLRAHDQYKFLKCSWRGRLFFTLFCIYLFIHFEPNGRKLLQCHRYHVTMFRTERILITSQPSVHAMFNVLIVNNHHDQERFGYNKMAANTNAWRITPTDGQLRRQIAARAVGLTSCNILLGSRGLQHPEALKTVKRQAYTHDFFLDGGGGLFIPGVDT